MKLTLRTIFLGATLCALILWTASVAHAGTIIKLNLGGVGPDIRMNAGGTLSTVPDGGSSSGDQLTAVEYTDFLDGIPDINTNVASFSLRNLQVDGDAQVIASGALVLQNFKNGTFDLYDASNNPLLSGTLLHSALTGVIGGSGTGALFTTSINTITGGSLQPSILAGSLTLSMTLANVNGSTGFHVTGVVLDQFQADASVLIKADSSGLGAPEPATGVMVLMGVAAGLAFCRRRAC